MEAVHFACLESEEMGPENEELPANEGNFASRFINLANVTGGRGLGKKELCQRMF